MTKKEKQFNAIIKEVSNTVDYYSRKIYNYNHIDCDDIKQEIYLRIFKALKNYNKKYAIKTYFTQVIKNEFLNQRNKMSSKHSYKKNGEVINIIFNDIELFKEILKDTNDISESISKKINDKEIIILRKFIKKEKAKKVYDYLVKGLTFREIANNLKLSTSAIFNIFKVDIIPIIQNNKTAKNIYSSI